MLVLVVICQVDLADPGGGTVTVNLRHHTDFKPPVGGNAVHSREIDIHGEFSR